uniref:Ovule protein n=1 Tax=Heterorhabditis bacteriophora TaxID=37862 RepID=A0A1I7WU73_HETBA
MERSKLIVIYYFPLAEFLDSFRSISLVPISLLEIYIRLYIHSFQYITYTNAMLEIPISIYNKSQKLNRILLSCITHVHIYRADHVLHIKCHRIKIIFFITVIHIYTMSLSNTVRPSNSQMTRQLGRHPNRNTAHVTGGI